MRIEIRGTVLALAAALAAATPAWAHPGHVTEGGVWTTLRHTLRSPYHLGVVVALVVLGVAWVVALRTSRSLREGAGAVEPPA